MKTATSRAAETHGPASAPALVMRGVLALVWLACLAEVAREAERERQNHFEQTREMVVVSDGFTVCIASPWPFHPYSDLLF